MLKYKDSNSPPPPPAAATHDHLQVEGDDVSRNCVHTDSDADGEGSPDLDLVCRFETVLQV